MKPSIEVFTTNLADVEPDPTTLSTEERARAARFQSATDRHRYLASHTWMRHVLAKKLGTSPQAITFDSGPNGKPTLLFPAGHLTFNLSHTDTVATLAIGQGSDVGIDIESYDPGMYEATTAARVLTQEEERSIAVAADSTEAFLRLWVRKEALFKAIGLGITDAVAVTDVSGPSPVEVSGLTITDLDLDLGNRLLGAVAAQPGTTVVVHHQPTPESAS